MSQLDSIKKIRENTGAGIVEIKKALEEAKGDEEKAVELLRKKGHEKAVKKSDRETKEGIIVSYVHSNQRVGTILELYCETDFVARNEEFQELAQDIAMHITAMNPQFVSPQDVDEKLVEKEKEIWKENLAQEGKPENIWENILSGKEKKFREELALLSQAFVKDPDMSVEDLIKEKIGKIGENIQVGKFYRLEL